MRKFRVCRGALPQAADRAVVLRIEPPQASRPIRASIAALSRGKLRPPRRAALGPPPNSRRTACGAAQFAPPGAVALRLRRPCASLRFLVSACGRHGALAARRLIRCHPYDSRFPLSFPDSSLFCVTVIQFFRYARAGLRPEILTRSVLACGCAPRAASGFTLAYRKNCIPLVTQRRLGERR